jgi:hypothetical protein
MLISVPTEVYLDADKEEDMITIDVDLYVDYQIDIEIGAIFFEVESFECEDKYTSQVEDLISVNYYENIIIKEIKER